MEAGVQRHFWMDLAGPVLQENRRVSKALRKSARFYLFFALLTVVSAQRTLPAQTVIAQISDMHLCSSHAPHAATNLNSAVQMVNKRSVDTVIISGDIGENQTCWLKAKSILSNLKAPVHYVPGNHDVHTMDVSTYRSVFGSDYYRFQVKNVDVILIDSQLLGNYDNYWATTPPPLPTYTQAQSEKMMTWLNGLVGIERKIRLPLVV